MRNKVSIIGSPWNLSSLWNTALHSVPSRVSQKRDYIYASELGGAYIDRYLKMHNIPMSNIPNDRSLRKFSAGHVFEWIVGMVLTMTGILKQKQLRGEVQLPGLLKVSGRLDFIAGGPVDWNKAREEIKRVQDVFSVSVSDMPPIIFHAIEHILVSMEKQYKANPLKEVVFECKSVSSFMSEKIEKTGAMSHHVLQCMHYLLANKMDEASLFYICKDDMIGQQFQIVNNKEILKAYRDDVKQMTEYYNASNFKDPMKTLPPKEALINFIDGVWRFEKNFKVEYSNYLEIIYGYATPEAYRMAWQYKIAGWNRVFKRAVKGDNITPANKIIIADAIKHFPLWDKYVAKAKAAGAFQKPEEEEEE